jgi:hypothetical protein
MFVWAEDASSGAIVALLGTTPSYDEDADHLKMFDAIVHQQRSAGRGVFVFMMDRDYPSPSARWRRRYADLPDHLPHTELRLAMVSPSKIAHGAVAAIQWMSPPGGGLEIGAFEDFDAAARWAAGESQLEVMRRLRDEVVAKRAAPTVRTAR